MGGNLLPSPFPSAIWQEPQYLLYIILPASATAGLRSSFISSGVLILGWFLRSSIFASCAGPKLFLSPLYITRQIFPCSLSLIYNEPSGPIAIPIGLYP